MSRPARKPPGRKPASPPPETPDQRDAREAEVLNPDVPLHLSGGRRVVVRKFRYGQELRLGERFRPIATALAQDLGARDLEVRSLWRAMEAHPDDFFLLLEEATGIPTAELEDLEAEDGELLALAFWRVNQSFFLKLVVAEYAHAQRAAVSLPGNSSPISSASATTPPN